MNSFDLFVGVTVIPLWKDPPRNTDEVRTRAEITEAFLKTSGKFAELLKHMILMQQQEKIP